MRSSLLPAAFISAGLLLSGCEGQTPSPDAAAAHQSESHDDHDHEHGHDHDHDHDHGHDHEAPETFAEAVTELAELRDAVKAALAENDLKKADGPVHELGHVLEALDKLAAKAGLSEEQQVTVKTAQETLFSSFGALDQTIHGKESGKTWDDVGSDIDQAIASLQEISPAGAAEGSES